MSIINNWAYSRQVIDWPKLKSATRNKFRVVSVREYVDKKGILPEGYTLTLMVMYDDFDYGVDKNGKPRENNVFQTFDVTVLNRKHPVKKGDFVALLDFDSEHSFVINFDLILRFKDYEVLQNQTVKPNA